jgi:acyl dehydratase
MASIAVGKTFPPITRSILARYAAASGDLNPVHLDSEAARSAGFPDVFAQGMLVMAYMGQALTDRVRADRLRSFSTRFLAVTRLGDVLTCSGVSGEARVEQGERRVTVELLVADQNGEAKLRGQAVVALRPEPGSTEGSPSSRARAAGSAGPSR